MLTIETKVENPALQNLYNDAVLEIVSELDADFTRYVKVRKNIPGSNCYVVEKMKKVIKELKEMGFDETYLTEYKGIVVKWVMEAD